MKSAPTSPSTSAGGLRLDKWLWAARLFKTRALAVQAIDSGRVRLNGATTKPSRELHVGDQIELRQAPVNCEICVRELCAQRRCASLAQAMYAETAASVASRQAAAELRRQGVEPADAQRTGRPTKRDRRELAQWHRWSASADEAQD